LAKKQKDALQKKGEISVKNAKIYNTFITFRSINEKVNFYEAFSSTPLQRCCLSCCSSKYDIRVMKGKVLKVQSAPQPINILWENIQYSSASKRIRRAIGWAITLLLFVIRK